MKDIFYENLDLIEKSNRTTTVEFTLWVPGMDLIHFGPVTMTERQYLEAKLTIADRSNDPIKTSSYRYTRDLLDVLDAIRTHCGGDDCLNDSNVISYLDPANNPVLQHDQEQEPATDDCKQQATECY